MKRTLISILLLNSLISYASGDLNNGIQKPKLFVAYDTGQAAFNKVQSLSADLGLGLPNKHLIRLVP